MKTLVVGGGSIGRRHINNLQSLGVDYLAVVEPDIQKKASLCEKGDIRGFDTLEEGLRWKPDLVVIATPTHLHVQQAIEVAQAGCDLFVEKPLSHTSSGFAKLCEVVSQRNLVSLVGCNMRFHPGPAKVKKLLEQKSIGEVLFARLYTGSYLPKWRPNQDYRKSYSASIAMGGGCILDCIHEIDLARWFLGEVKEVFCVARKLSSLEIETEDVAILVCEHTNRSLSEIHLDYVQRSYERGCQIVGEKGSIFWDYRDGAVRWFDADQDCWLTFSQPHDWQINQMYLDEMRHLLSCMQTRAQTVFSIPEAVEVMKIALAAKISARSGRFVSPGDIL